MDTKLYPGIAFSPQAQLTDNIGAADTIIPVSDVSAFPPAPNLATIGTDVDGETILYAAKTAAALSGCTRGVEGSAKPWNAGESIGRNFTAVDHSALISAAEENDAAANGALELAGSARDSAEKAGGAAAAALVAAQAAADAASELREAVDSALALKQPLLTGLPGQVVGFNAEGEAEAMDLPEQAQGGSGVNLLDNWYFPDPINQRGLTEYTPKGYAIDRWYKNNTKLSVKLEDDGVLLAVPEGNTSDYNQFIQILPKPLEVHRTYTASVLLATDAQIMLFVQNSTGGHTVCGFGLNTNGNISLVSHTFTISDEEHTDINYIRFNFGKTGGAAKIIAVKLELGGHQTLAHQDEDGNWVLNDPPPNEALELLKCQRYFQVFSDESLRPVKAMDFRPPMRVNPALGTMVIDGTTYYTADANL